MSDAVDIFSILQARYGMTQRTALDFMFWSFR
jgi:hypothetical protein